MKNVLKKKKYVFLSIILIFVITLSYIIVSNNNKELVKNIDINKVLKSEAYAYLPVEAKNYVEKIYNETGEVLYTEKNKEENVPYLNPKYVEYLSMDYETRNIQEVIPSETIIDYIYSENNVTLSEDEIPTSYDLRDVNGKNYVTPIKNQGNLSLSWAFATTAQVESYLLATNEKSYEEDVSETFSERQIDYATSNNGITEFSSDFYFDRELGSGGNFRTSSYAITSGLSLFDSSWKEYNDTDFEKMNYYEVINFKDSKYELNSTIEMPYLNLKELDLANEEDVLIKNNYLNTIKENIMIYGGAFVSAKNPEGKCSLIDSNNNYFIYDDNNCVSTNYAMQIIGWDDNYEYKFCSNVDAGYGNDISSCDNIISGKGAWLLKRSINSEDDNAYGYLAYDSYNLEYNIISDISSSSEKDWDNVYIYPTYSDEKYFEKNVEEGEVYYTYRNGITKYMTEKVMGVKFFASTQNSEYKIYTRIGYGEWKLIKTVDVDLPGLYNIYLSNYDYKFNFSNPFCLKIIDENGNSVLKPILYTKNIERKPVVDDSYYNYYNSLDTSTEDYYEMSIGTFTRNIDSHEKIDYILYDSDGNDISSKMTYSNNFVADNYVYTNFRIDSDLDVYDPYVGNSYKISVVYNDEPLNEIYLDIMTEVNVIEGTGTREAPYVITTPNELYMINEDLDAHYVLGNDINFSREYVTIYGTFRGTLDGQGYSINGLPNFYEDFMDMGLFEEIGVGYEHDTVIKNLNITNISLLAYSYSNATGILANKVIDCYDNIYCDSDKKVIINNVSIQNSNVEDGLNSGGLIGEINVYKENGVELDQIYVNASVYGRNNSGGVVGKIVTIDDSVNASVKFSNISSSSEINYSEHGSNKDFTIDYSGSNFVGELSSNINAENILLIGNASPLDENSYKYGIVFGNVLKNGDNDINCNTKNIIYYSDYEPMYSSYATFELTGVAKKSFDELKNIDTYSDWDNFRDIWVIETINDVTRFPILKFMQNKFDYITVNEVESIYKEEVNLYDYVSYIDSPLTIDSDLWWYYNPTRKIDFSITDDSIANIDNINGRLYGKQIGNYNIHVKSTYDGFENDVVLNIDDEGLLYTITYHSNNGKNETYERGVYDETQNLDGNYLFVKEGYKFDNWNTKADGSGKKYYSYDDISELDTIADIDLYAMWYEDYYEVIFVNTKNLSESKSQYIDYEKDEKLDLNTFSSDGYKFKEWNTSRDGSGTSYQDGAIVKNLASTDYENVYLYAIWEEFSHSIKYVANDGTESYVLSDKPYSDFGTLESNLFEREGYLFDSWNTEPDGSGSKYEINTLHKNLVYSENNELTLYAQWKDIKYEITYNSNGGTGMMSNLPFVENETKNLTLNTYERRGYIFDGWNTNADGTGDKYTDGQEITINDNITLYAQWALISYKVAFHSKGGTGTMNTITLSYNQSLKITNTFKKKGYKIKEFNTDFDGLGTSYENNQFIFNLTTENNDYIVLYAIWEPIEYTIEFNSNGGTGTKESKILSYDRSFLLINTFERPGYTFKEWNTSSDGKGDSFSNKQEVTKLTTEDNSIITLYAIWEPISYKIIFEPNKGTGTMDEMNLDYGIEYNLLENKFIRDGYEFIGWNTKEDGSGDSYSDKDLVSNLTVINSDVVRLYAQWEPKKYKITFISNGGNSVETIEAEKDEVISEPTQPTKKYYKFDGWYTEPEFINKFIFNKMSSQNITLYAKWNKYKTTINFNSVGGTVIESITDYAGDKVISPSNPSKEGYKFEGWYTEKELKNKYTFDVMPESDITLYAKWSKIDLSVKVNNYKENNNEVSDISNSTSINNYLKNFSYNNSLQVKVYNFKNELITDNNKLIGTGSKVKFYDNGILIDEFTNIVRADNTGDGVVDLADLSKLFNHYRGNITMSGVYLKASNIAGDSNVDLADLSKLFNYYRGNIKEI